MLHQGVTIFIPLYNEEAILKDNVLLLCDQMATLNQPHEVILGSNGSTDRTFEYSEQLALTFSHITCFHVARRGPGLAFAEALHRIQYEFLVCVDADLSVDFDFVPRAIEALAVYDAVVGSKQMGDQHRPWLRVTASNLFIACTNWLLDMPYHDYSLGAKAYRTEVVLPFAELIDRHTFYTQTLLYQLQQQGRKILEIPVMCHDERQSRFNLLHEGVYRYSKLFLLWVRSLLK